ncbi:MAG TPA: AAA family ATPase [Planctomycetaceae bacterium]|mgnify:FL=1|nr:AAA family ATPase [Planctomycetaceae bacterium]
MSTSWSSQSATSPESFEDLFERVNMILGDTTPTRPDSTDSESFVPRQPLTLKDVGVSYAVLERIILRFLLSTSAVTGRRIATQLRLPWKLTEPLLKQLRQEKHIDLTGTTAAGDSEFVLTPTGRERARQYLLESSYFGAAPVPLEDYANAVAQQSPSRLQVRMADLRRAFRGLILSDQTLERLGPAIKAGRGLFLYGNSGNGKTSIAERISEAFGSTIWIPRSVAVEGDIIRIFDPRVHTELDDSTTAGGLLDSQDIDRRWVRIRRPTIVAGGELTMDELELQLNPTSRVCEAPLQVKGNCGTLVIDDFGRQRMPIDELLNRWIIPLERRHDFLNTPSGKKVRFPFDLLMVFSTNLEPHDLVDGAFLRRIPYKVEISDPSETEFRQLFEAVSLSLNVPIDSETLDYLLQRHYRDADRPMRSCHPRDLLLQVQNYCQFHDAPLQATRPALDAAVQNYFAITAPARTHRMPSNRNSGST